MNSTLPKATYTMISKIPSIASSTVQSPCIDICELDDENICIGCYRSIDEITGWGSLNSSEKVIILDQADKRRKTAE